MQSGAYQQCISICRVNFHVSLLSLDFSTNSSFSSSKCQTFICKYICDSLRDLLPFKQFKKRENTRGGVLLKVCNFIKNNTPPWVFFIFFKIVQILKNCTKRLIWQSDILRLFTVNGSSPSKDFPLLDYANVSMAASDIVFNIQYYIYINVPYLHSRNLHFN